jgi:Acyl transferase domain
MLGVQSIHLVIPLVYFSQRNLLRSHSSSLRRLHLKICVSKALFRRIAHSLDIHISALVDVVFYRGITMQRAVERDSENRSNYTMCAVNPSRVSTTFSDAALREVVDSIATRTASLLEIANYNVEVSLPF